MLSPSPRSLILGSRALHAENLYNIVRMRVRVTVTADNMEREELSRNERLAAFKELIYKIGNRLNKEDMNNMKLYRKNTERRGE